jgi:hypothetical protein
MSTPVSLALSQITVSHEYIAGFYAVTHGWKLFYMPLCLACGICPDTPRAFFSQQVRCAGIWLSVIQSC